ncbi:MAG: glycosyltransferase family 39 protein [Weeksellaceae bacterium]|nr:glycosyltransferase family 39 protein [Weeksellaceae bacterium]
MNKTDFAWMLGAILLVHATGLLVEVFAGDSALYALLSEQIARTGNYADLYLYGEDWLDKPHFPFWVSGFAMQLLGANAFAYKLPSFLLFVVGLFYTYKLAQKLYDTNTARWAVVILGASLHLIISNNDVRAEAMLLGLIMGAVYHLYRLINVFSLKHLLLAALFSAAAVMTKGIFVLIILYSAIGGYLLLKKDFRTIFHWKWVLTLALTAVFVLPEIWVLYTQFDSQMHKTVFGRTQVSGIRFFLWDSQIGRFFNTGPIKGKGDPLFFLHTMFWAMAPWAIAAYYVLADRVLKRNSAWAGAEWLTVFGFVVMFVVFSASGFQLPHYTNILFPFLAILTAAWWTKFAIVRQSARRVFTISIWVYSVLYVVVIALLEYFFMPGVSVYGIVCAAMILLVLIFRHQLSATNRTIWIGVLTTLAFCLYLNLEFYPRLLQYQSGMQVAKYMKTLPEDTKKVSLLDDYLLQFYSRGEFEYIRDAELVSDDEQLFIFAGEEHLETLRNSNANFEILRYFPNFHITRLNAGFINHRSREQTLNKHYLIKLHGSQENK